MKTTEANLNPSQLMNSANLTSMVLGVVLALPVSGIQRALLMAARPDLMGIAAVIALGAGIYYYASMQQIRLVRSLGPAVYASFSSVRVVVGVVVGGLWLAERMGFEEVLGVAVVGATVSWYTAVIARDEDRPLKTPSPRPKTVRF